MSAPGYTSLKLYRSSTPGAQPTAANLADGELAINTTDEKLFFKNTGGTVVSISTAVSGGTVTSVAASGGTTGLTFSGSPITTSGTLTLSGTLGVANGGTGATTLTANYILKGNGTSALSASQIFDNGTTVGINQASPAANAKLDVNGGAVTNIVAVAASAVDCSAGNYFIKTATGALTWTATNVPASRAYSFILELTNGGTGTQTWFSGIKWPGGTAPTLTTSGVDVLGFITDDGGTTWRGVQLMKDSK